MFYEGIGKTSDHRVSIVEDDASLVSIMSKILANAGYTVLKPYASGEEFLKNLETEKPDIILMDIMLEGGLNGIETANRVRGKMDVPIVFMTANNDDRVFLEAVKEDPFAYIMKPFKEKELEHSLKLALFKHNTEARINSNRAWLQKILVSIGDGVITADRNGMITFMNPVAEEITKHQLKSAHGKHLNEVFKIEQESGEPIIDPFKRVIDEGIIVHLDNRIILTDSSGVKKPISDSGAPIRNSKGEVAGVVIIFKDNTAQDEMKKSLNETSIKIERMEKQNRMILDSLVEGVLVFDTEGYVTFANPAFFNITGLKGDSVIQVSADELFGRVECDLPDDFLSAMKVGFKKSKTGDNFQFSMTKPDGESIIAEVTLSIMKENGDMFGTILTFADITDRIMKEDELIKKDAQLLQAQKMEAVGRLAGGVAHDFNNILQAMLGLIELMKITDVDEEKVEKMMTEVGSYVNRGINLSKKLLMFSRSEKPDFKTSDLNVIINETADLLKHLIAANIRIKYILCGEVLPVEADASQLEQVLINLVVNASDAMPGGGEIIISTEKLGGGCLMKVKDNGTGMDRKTVDRIFEPFFTTKAKEKGTGLGLSVVHGIIEQHGAVISVESEVGAGTEFIIQFKLTERSGIHDEKSESAGKSIERGGYERILIVEDTEDVRTSLQEMLASVGYSAEVCANAEDAEKILIRENFDLLITDYMLPGMNGLELAERARKLQKGLKILVMSGYADNERIDSEKLKGHIRFLQKPFDLKTLTGEINSYLKSKP